LATGTARAARLADVARAAGVGTSIASRVLNHDPTVSIRPETRERILAAALELNYRPNALARGLRLARTMTIGIIINLAYYY
jgi:LacI family transcriptional regulator